MSINSWMDKEDVVCVHRAHKRTHPNGLLLICKEEWNYAICSNMDGPRDYHTQWSKSDKDKYHMISLIYGTLKNDTNELIYKTEMGFPDSSVGKESTWNVGGPGSIPGSGRSLGERIGYLLQCSWASLVAQLIKNLPAIWETWVGKIPWRSERLPTPVFWPGEFHGQSLGLQRVRHDWVTFTFIFTFTKQK